MIGLRVAHLVSSLNVSAAASCAINMVRWLRDHGHEAVLVTAGGSRESSARAEGVPIIPFKDRGLRWWLAGAKRLLGELVAWQPDILHVHRVDDLPLAVNLAQRLGVSLVASVHRELQAAEAEALEGPMVDLVLVPNEALRAHLVGRLKLDRDRVAVLPYGIDPNRFPVEAVVERPLTIGTLGNFDEHAAGYGDLIEALSVLRQKGHAVHGLLIGSGGGRERLAALVDERGLDDAIRIEESGPHSAPLLARMDIFVYPFMHDSHSIGIIKAMAAGCAVVASAVGSVQEMVQDEQTGLLIPPGDSGRLALALARLVSEPELLRSLREAGLAMANEFYNIDRIGPVAHDLYRRALRGNAAGASAGATETVTAYRRLTNAGAGRDG